MTLVQLQEACAKAKVEAFRVVHLSFGDWVVMARRVSGGTPLIAFGSSLLGAVEAFLSLLTLETLSVTNIDGEGEK